MIEKRPRDFATGIPRRTGETADEDPVLYARFFIPGSNREWFVTGIEQREGEIVFWGFSPSCHYGHRENTGSRPERFSLAALSKAAEILRSRLERDPDFMPRPLSEAESG